MKSNTYLKGHLAEFIALIWLTCKGYLVIRRRFKTRAGEIDLIAKRGKYLVAIEVKARPTLQLGLEAIRPQQQKRICRALRLFRHRKRWQGLIPRYDAIVICPKSWPHHIIDVWRETY